jgi:predicted MFS family arabinose efflux permease
MVAFGFGEVVGGLIHGWLIDTFGSRRTIAANILVLIIVFSVTEMSLFTLKYNLLTFIMCFMWGYEDGTQNIYLMKLLGNEFGASGDPFAVYNIL